MEPVKIRLDNFEGPYDLLLSLLDKNKLDITEISISEIADQYIDYISCAGGFDLDIASEFLIMGVTLIHMKSKRLLPKPEVEDEELTAEELARRLALYKSIKKVSALLEESMSFWSLSHYKEAEKISFPIREEILDLNLFELSNSRTILQQRLINRRNDNTGKMEKIIETEKVSLKDKMRQIVSAVAKKTKTKFSEMFSTKKQSKTEVVTGFLAILELDRRRKVILTQDSLFSEINIFKNEDVDYDDFDNFFDEFEEYNEIEGL